MFPTSPITPRVLDRTGLNWIKTSLKRSKRRNAHRFAGESSAHSARRTLKYIGDVTQDLRLNGPSVKAGTAASLRGAPRDVRVARLHGPDPVNLQCAPQINISNSDPCQRYGWRESWENDSAGRTLSDASKPY
ncbi:unnamed protein product, partial [Iphiclides podalirius]